MYCFCKLHKSLARPMNLYNNTFQWWHSNCFWTK
jgi:hypothetical protein